jgi:hypothetical protein
MWQFVTHRYNDPERRFRMAAKSLLDGDFAWNVAGSARRRRSSTTPDDVFFQYDVKGS